MPVSVNGQLKDEGSLSLVGHLAGFNVFAFEGMKVTAAGFLALYTFLAPAAAPDL